MLTTNHPDDERLSALAGRDDDAVADTALVAHVDGCGRCADLVTELGALRASLAELPDVTPSRPLRLLPAVDPETSGADRLGSLGGWVRRLFSPALTAGVALAMVGLVGTTVPALEGMAGGADAGSELAIPDAEESSAAQSYDSEAAGEPGDREAVGESDRDQRVLSSSDAPSADEGDTDELRAGSPDPLAAESPEGGPATASLPAERSPWPMVLFTGVAIAIGALLLRWIFVPRAG